MIVKVYRALAPRAAYIVDAAKTFKQGVLLDEALMNKMNRRDRAYFDADRLEDGTITLYKRLPDQGW